MLIQFPVDKPHLKHQRPDESEMETLRRAIARVAGSPPCSARECPDRSLTPCPDCGDPYCLPHLTRHRCVPPSHPVAVGA